MPWPEEHRAQTRQRIVEAAAAAFRAGGVAGVTVQDVMTRAGLTHGGFYAYFASKDDLLRAAVEHAGRETLERLSNPLKGAAADARLHALVDVYLSAAHAAHPERGCPLAALGSELARGHAPARGALAHGVSERLAWMRELLPSDERDAVSDERMMGVLACMIGGVVLARAVADKDAVQVLAACREFLHEALNAPANRRRRRRRQQRRPR